MSERRPVLLAVAHGSRDQAASRAVLALTAGVSKLDPAVDVRAAFVENAEPALATALADATRDGREVVIVPLLLSAGYHVRHDIGSAAAKAGVAVAGPLGPDARLVPALAGRLAQAGVPDGAPVVLAAAGSRDPQAAAGTQRQAALLAAHRAGPVAAAYLSAGRPTVDEAVACLAGRADWAGQAGRPGHTGGPVAVAAYLLAPGFFHQRLRQSAATWVTDPLAGHAAVASLVLDRFRAARGPRGPAAG